MINRIFLFLSIAGLILIFELIPPAFSIGEVKNQVIIPFGAFSPVCARTDSCYIPSELIIAENSTVLWKNSDYAIHTVTSGNLWSGHDGLFNSEIMERYEEFEFNFSGFQPGKYTYYCIMHPWMLGSIIIFGESTTPQEIIN